MAISREEIQKIASLARLDLSEAEILKYQEQLSSILKHIDALKKAAKAKRQNNALKNH